MALVFLVYIVILKEGADAGIVGAGQVEDAAGYGLQFVLLDDERFPSYLSTGDGTCHYSEILAIGRIHICLCSSCSLSVWLQNDKFKSSRL